MNQKLKDIAIFGAGGFGREVACLLRKINMKEPTWNFLGFYDDGLEKGSHVDYGEILGGISDLNAVDRPLNVVVALGVPATLKKVVEKIHNENIQFPNIISPDTQWLDPDNVRLGQGNVLSVGSYFSCNVSMGDFNMFVGYTTVGHDSAFGSYNSLMPGARVSGKVTIGDGNLIGSGSVVLQGLTVGCDTTIAAGSIIMSNTKDGHTYLGSPAKKVF